MISSRSLREIGAKSDRPRTPGMIAESPSSPASQRYRPGGGCAPCGPRSSPRCSRPRGPRRSSRSAPTRPSRGACSRKRRAGAGASVHRGPRRPRRGGRAAPRLVHGEPNWYSVSEPSSALMRWRVPGGSPLPLTLVHGVDWPTGRRDAYPNPAAVPVGARQPHAPEGGVERALDEHDQRNGVLTAVEDFLAGQDERSSSPHSRPRAGRRSSSRAALDGQGSRALASRSGAAPGPQALAQLAAIEAERVRRRRGDRSSLHELEAARSRSRGPDFGRRQRQLRSGSPSWLAGRRRAEGGPRPPRRPSGAR